MNCSFCPKTKRAKAFMLPGDFLVAAQKIRPLTQYIYLHISGEPLLSPYLEDILKICEEFDFKVSITTNGTLIEQQKNLLLSSKAVYKVSISLHSFEANEVNFTLKSYVNSCAEFAKTSAQKGILSVLRLWNIDGLNTLNPQILGLLKSHFSEEWQENRKGFTLKDKLFIERAQKFDWPNINGEEKDVHFCMGGRDQLGILVDGTVVPCCLDNEGNIPLGNIFTDNLEEILNSKKYKTFFDSFSQRKPCEELCKRCGYAEKMFK